MDEMETVDVVVCIVDCRETLHRFISLAFFNASDFQTSLL